MSFVLYFYGYKTGEVRQLQECMGDTTPFLCWFNTETDEGMVTVVNATNPDAYILAHNALFADVLIGYDVSR